MITGDAMTGNKQDYKNNSKTVSLELAGKIRQLIVQSRKNLAIQVNHALTQLCWQIGYTIHENLSLLKIKSGLQKGGKLPAVVVQQKFSVLLSRIQKNKKNRAVELAAE
ncbi:MAG: DUF1016 domain-containing protein [FCB group bacterium]|nr:DUF1016 domain-containing protein [FCB group bacterium]